MSGGQIRIGISGWTYPPWRGVFYPPGLPQKQELRFAAARFPTIEINGTFYGTQSPQSFQKWRDETPEDFVFAVKGPRYITHLLRLREVETPLANFFASGVLRLGPKFGPVLWQFPPRMRYDEARFEAFFRLLPRDGEQAAALALRHDERLRHRAWIEIDRNRKLRHAVEIRHESFRDKAFIALLRRYRIALVCADSVEWPRLMDVTSDFIYCRLHGSEALYASGYDPEALRSWGRRVRSWSEGREPADAERVAGPARPAKAGRDVFLYFDNDMKLRAPADAQGLAKLLELG